MNLRAPITMKQATGITLIVALLMTVLLANVYVVSGYQWLLLVPILTYWLGAAWTIVLQRRNPDSALLMMRAFVVPSGCIGIFAGLLAYVLEHGGRALWSFVNAGSR